MLVEDINVGVFLCAYKTILVAKNTNELKWKLDIWFNQEYGAEN